MVPLRRPTANLFQPTEAYLSIEIIPLKKVTLSFPLNFSPGFTTADLEWKLILIPAGQHNLTGSTDGGQFLKVKTCSFGCNAT